LKNVPIRKNSKKNVHRDSRVFSLHLSMIDQFFMIIISIVDSPLDLKLIRFCRVHHKIGTSFSLFLIITLKQIYIFFCINLSHYSVHKNIKISKDILSPDF